MAFADLCRHLAAVGRTKTRRSPREGRAREVVGMELVDIVLITGIFGVFNIILYIATISLLREHEKMIDKKMKSGRRA